MKKIIALLGIALTGCASTGPVQISKDTYMNSKNGSGGIFGTTTILRSELIKESSAFCTKDGKVFQLNSTQDRPAGSGQPFATSEIYFMCLDANDPEVARIKQQRQADAVIETRQR